MTTSEGGPRHLDAPAPLPLPPPDARGHVDHDGARIAYVSYGAGRRAAKCVILLHGAFGNGEDWGNQVPALTSAGYRALLVDSRGHGRSTRDARPLTYAQLASDVLAVMDAEAIAQADVVGWSDGAIIGLSLAMTSAGRVRRVFAFGANSDLGGLKEISMSNPTIAQVFDRATKAYARLSETPADFAAFARAVTSMTKTQPDFRAEQLAAVRVPVAVVAGETDEFITREHTDYLARTIPGATRIILAGVSHFAPLQRPDAFNAAMLTFLGAS